MDQNVIIEEVPTGAGAEEVFVSDISSTSLPRLAISFILSMRTRENGLFSFRAIFLREHLSDRTPLQPFQVWLVRFPSELMIS
jgi:hypothetical protein